MDPKEMDLTVLKKTNKEEVEKNWVMSRLDQDPKTHNIFETHPWFY